jgi:sigma-B regulation protein RsbU (phosphoserine phosphatase)
MQGEPAAVEDVAAVLSMRVPTRAALGCPVAQTVVRALGLCLRPESFDADAIETAVHEALLNAAIHGNLATPRPAEAGLEGFCWLADQVDQQLDVGLLGERPIRLKATCEGPELHITVRDEGDGFVPGAGPAAEPRHPYGRGLRLMRALAHQVSYDLGGREVRLTFRLLPPA